MREIKFRTWDVDEEEWYNNEKIPYQLIDNEGVFYWADDYEWNRYPGEVLIMQYTGLKDKNGVEIYEGDIVENASKDLKFQVVYEAPSFNRKWIDNTSKRYREHLTEPLAWNTYMICEVIGNIYENPELLGDSQ